MSTADKQAAKIESISIATQTQLQSRLHNRDMADAEIDTNLFVLYILSVAKANGNKTLHYMYKQVPLKNVALNNGTATSDMLAAQVTANSEILPNASSCEINADNFTKPHIHSVEIQFRDRPWVQDQSTQKWQTQDVDKLVPAIITTFDYEIAAGTGTRQRKNIGMRIWYENKWWTLPSVGELLGQKQQRIDAIDGVVVPLQNSYKNKWTFDDDTFVMFYKSRQVNCKSKNQCQWKVNRFTFKLFWEQPTGSPKPRIQAAKIDVFHRWQGKVPKFGWKSFVRGYNEGKPICAAERKYNRRHAACTKRNKCVVQNCDDMDEIEGGCLRCRMGFVKSDNGMTCYRPVDSKATKGCAYMEEEQIMAPVPAFNEEEFLKAKAIKDQRNWETEIIEECQRFDDESELNLLSRKHNILAAAYWRAPVIESTNDGPKGLQKTENWASESYQSDRLDAWEAQTETNPKFAGFMMNHEWSNMFMSMFKWFVKDLAAKLETCVDCPDEDDSPHSWNENNSVWVTSGLHGFFSRTVKQKMQGSMARERMVTRHGIKLLKDTAKTLKHCGNERPWGTSPVLMAKLAIEYGYDKKSNAELAEMDKVEAQWDLKKQRAKGDWKGLASDITMAYVEQQITQKDEMELVNLQAAKNSSVLNYMIAQYHKDNTADMTKLRSLVDKAYNSSTDGFGGSCPAAGDASKGAWGSAFCGDLEEMMTFMTLNNASNVEQAWREHNKDNTESDDLLKDLLIAQDQKVWADEFCGIMQNKVGKSVPRSTAWRLLAYNTFQKPFDEMSPAMTASVNPTWYNDQKSGFDQSLQLFNQSAFRFIKSKGTNPKNWSAGVDSSHFLGTVKAEVLSKVDALWAYALDWAGKLKNHPQFDSLNASQKEALNNLFDINDEVRTAFTAYRLKVVSDWQKLLPKLANKTVKQKTRKMRQFLRNALRGFNNGVLKKDRAMWRLFKNQGKWGIQAEYEGEVAVPKITGIARSELNSITTEYTSNLKDGKRYNLTNKSILMTFAKNMALEAKLGKRTATVATRRFKQVVLTSEKAWRDAERRQRNRANKQRKDKCQFDMENEALTEVQKNARNDWRDSRTKCIQCKDGWRHNPDNNPLDPGSPLCEEQPKCANDEIQNPFYDSEDDPDCIQKCDPRFAVNIHVLRAKGCVDENFRPPAGPGHQCVVFCSASKRNFMVQYVDIETNPNHFSCPTDFPTSPTYPTGGTNEAAYCRTCAVHEKPTLNSDTGAFECAPVCVANNGVTPTGWYDADSDTSSPE
jgi:hypothetical protein